MHKPPDRDMGADLMSAQALAAEPLPSRLSTLYDWFNYGPMDYQRKSGGKANIDYQDAGNYIYGAITAAAGIPDWFSRAAGVVHNLFRGRVRPGSWGSPPQNYQMWDQGRSDYLNNRLSYPGVQPAGPPIVYPPLENQNPDTVPAFPGLAPLGPATISPTPTTDGLGWWPRAPS
jgi:hypothetical protein